MNTVNECLVPGCQDEAATRGLCSVHYQNARRLVLRSKISWDSLEKDGKVKKRYNRHKDATKFFLDGKKTSVHIRE